MGHIAGFSIVFGCLIAIVVLVRWSKRRTAASEEASKIRAIVDHVADGIATVDDSFRIVSWNRAAERIFSYSAAEILGRSLNDIITGWPESDTATPREATGRRRDGSSFPVEIGVGAFSMNTRTYYTAVFQDITERKAADEALRLARDVAAEASNAKSRFLANMSHEIRTPLGALLGFSELLVTGPESEEERIACISAIRRNGTLLSNIINDILDLSKIEAGNVQVEKTTVRLSEVITDITSLLGLQAQEKGILLTVRYNGHVPYRIRTDALRLRQILVNIVGNAIKFTSRGEVEVSIKQIAREGELPLLAFVVRDTGPGIAEATAAQLFSSFAQGDSSRTRSRGGAGLGLVLARRLAQLLGGNVDLTSSVVGRGSTFTITVDPGNAEGLSEVEPLDLASARPEARLDRVKILLVDDSPDNQVLIARFLKMAGASVAIANNGHEGIERATAENFDLIVMDIQMPVMDGYEAVTHLRRAGYARPVIALTAHALREEQQRCLASGFDDHLSKPINRQFLVARLEMWAFKRPFQASHEAAAYDAGHMARSRQGSALVATARTH